MDVLSANHFASLKRRPWRFTRTCGVDKAAKDMKVMAWKLLLWLFRTSLSSLFFSYEISEVSSGK